RLGVRQLWPAIEGLQANRFLAEEPSSMNGDAVYDRALHLEVRPAERKAAVEAAEITEPQTSRDDDLQIFDLDLDALPDRFDEKAAVDAKPSSQETAHGEARPTFDSSEVAASDETELQVYDLDLSTLLG